MSAALPGLKDGNRRAIMLPELTSFALWQVCGKLEIQVLLASVKIPLADISCYFSSSPLGQLVQAGSAILVGAEPLIIIIRHVPTRCLSLYGAYKTQGGCVICFATSFFLSPLPILTCKQQAAKTQDLFADFFRALSIKLVFLFLIYVMEPQQQFNLKLWRTSEPATDACRLV